MLVLLACWLGSCFFLGEALLEGEEEVESGGGNRNVEVLRVMGCGGWATLSYGMKMEAAEPRVRKPVWMELRVPVCTCRNT
jgi:hypothetical protein